MKRWPGFILCTVLCTVLGLALGACGAEPTPTPLPTATPVPPTPVPPTPVPPTQMPVLPLGDQEVRADAGGYTLRYPEGWSTVYIEGLTLIYSQESQLVEMSSGVPSVPIVVVQGGALATVADGSVASAENSQQMAEMVGGGVSTLGTNVAVTGSEPVMVGGHEGFAMDAEGSGFNNTDTQIGARIVCVHMGDWGVVVMGLGEVEAWQSFLPTFNAIVASMTLFEPTIETPPDMALVSQWAVGATASSEYSTPSWAAIQAIGAPDTLECGDIRTAWASSSSTTVDWLELTYAVPVIPHEIHVFQTYNPDQVSLVEVIDVNGTYHQVYTGEPAEMEQCPYILSIPLQADYQAVGVRVTVDQSVLGIGWNEIDAVELIGYVQEPIPPGVTPWVPGGQELPTPVEPTAAPPAEPPAGFVWRLGGESGYQEGQFNAFAGMAFGPDGILYIGDSLGRILMVSPDGEFLGPFVEGDLWNASGLAVTDDGTVYVADWGSNAVFAFSSDGEQLYRWGEEGTGEGQFGGFSPTLLAVCPDGLVFVHDSNEDTEGNSYERIQVFDLAGSYLYEWNLSEVAGSYSVSGMTCGPDGNLYMVGFIGSRVLVFDPTGTLLEELGDEALSFTAPNSLAVDSDGYIYVGTWNEGMILLYPDGTLYAQWGVNVDEEGPRYEGQLYFPDAVAVDADGYVYVGDWGGRNSYVTKFYFP